MCKPDPRICVKGIQVPRPGTATWSPDTGDRLPKGCREQSIWCEFWVCGQKTWKIWVISYRICLKAKYEVNDRGGWPLSMGYFILYRFLTKLENLSYHMGFFPVCCLKCLQFSTAFASMSTWIHWLIQHPHHNLNTSIQQHGIHCTLQNFEGLNL